MHRAHYACGPRLGPPICVQSHARSLKSLQIETDQVPMRVPGSALLTAAAAALAFAVAPGAASADSACPDSDLQPTAANLPQVEAATLCMINVQRSQHGLAPLTANSVLQGAAVQHSQDMVSN